MLDLDCRGYSNGNVSSTSAGACEKIQVQWRLCFEEKGVCCRSYLRKQSINYDTYLHGKGEMYSIMLSRVNKARR